MSFPPAAAREGAPQLATNGSGRFRWSELLISRVLSAVGGHAFFRLEHLRLEQERFGGPGSIAGRLHEIHLWHGRRRLAAALADSPRLPLRASSRGFIKFLVPKTLTVAHRAIFGMQQTRE